MNIKCVNNPLQLRCICPYFHYLKKSEYRKTPLLVPPINLNFFNAKIVRGTLNFFKYKLIFTFFFAVNYQKILIFLGETKNKGWFVNKFNMYNISNYHNA